MPDPDELATQHAEYAEARASHAADSLEERFEIARLIEQRRIKAVRDDRIASSMKKAILEHPAAVTDEGRAAADLIGGTELATSPWECPSRLGSGHPDHCGIFTNPPMCRVGGCTKLDQEGLNG